MTIPTWLITTTSLIVGGIAVALPLVIDAKTPRIISSLYWDVSDSNQQAKNSVIEICQERLKQLKEGDSLIDGVFADRVYILANHSYSESDYLTSQKQCEQAMERPQGIGNQPGTPFFPVLQSFEQEVNSQRHLGNQKRVVAVFVFNAVETPQANQQSLDSKAFTEKVQSLVQGGHVLVFIGTNVDFQAQLKKALANVQGNVRVCSYSDATGCLVWGHELARQ